MNILKEVTRSTSLPVIGQILRRHRLSRGGPANKSVAVGQINTTTQVQVQVHHCKELSQETKLEKIIVKSDVNDKSDAVKIRDCVKNVGGEKEVFLQLVNSRATRTPSSTHRAPRTRKIVEFASFDNVFSPYIRPPT